MTAGGRRVVAVVVTHNRRALLVESLAAIDAQSRPPDAVIVVDNASTDGTPLAVRACFPHVRLSRLDHNTGGAGGFAAGLSAALDDDADLIWLMDDDTVPAPGALAALLRAGSRHRRGWPAALASRAVWTDGREHPMNTPRRRPFADAARVAAAREVGAVPIRSASFVSLLVRADAVRASGLPRAEFFLWNDDFEFTARLLRHGDGLWCPASTVVHKTRTFGSTDTDPGERFFYEVRNKIWMLRTREPLGALEWLCYTGSTLRRWVRTFAGSTDRRTLARAFRRGVSAGLHPEPALSPENRRR